MIYAFNDFELDTRLFELRRAGAVVPVEPQVFDVLALLVECRDRVVGKDEILQRVWGDRFISESTLASRMTAARKAIADSAKRQALIKTIHGRGYRFVAEVEQHDRQRETGATATGPATAGARSAAGGQATHHPAESRRPRREAVSARAARDPGSSSLPAPVGRDPELASLRGLLAAARGGNRQVVFVTGEAGLGKTTLVQTFLRCAGNGDGLIAATGQCLEHSGVGESYMPMLEALGRVCRGPGGAERVDMLVRRAPTWMAQMPWLLSDPQLDALRRQVGDIRPERMLREMGEALETLTAERPLLLVLEDLHWSDPSTVDLVSWIAARTDPCRLMVIGTYRPEEIVSAAHPLPAAHQRLRLRGQCTDLALPFLDENAVRQYVATSLPGDSLPEKLAPVILERTDGNPLFMVNLIAAWVAEGLLVEQDGRWELRGEPGDLASRVPETLRQLIDLRLAGLDSEACLALECASVVGVAFSSAAVAAGCEHPEEQVEQRLTALAAEGRFLQARGETEWPDGTVAARFEFIHSLYRDVLYERVPGGVRARVHGRIGKRLERAYGARSDERASELALHFERAREPLRAVHYLRVAGLRALDRSAHREAVTHFDKALRLLAELPEDEDTAREELEIRVVHSPALASIRGWAEPAVEHAFTRAHELCQRFGDSPWVFPVLYGLAEMYELRGDFDNCQRTLFQDAPDPAWPRLEYHEMLACSTFHQARYDEALEHAELAFGAFDPRRPDPYAKAYGESPAVRTHQWIALTLWFTGYPDRSVQRMRQGLALAEGSGLMSNLSAARSMMAFVHQLRREPEPTSMWARQTIEVAGRYGFPYREAMARLFHGWALAIEGQPDPGIVQIREVLDLSRRIGVELDRPYFLALLAEAFGEAGRIDDGLAAIAEALDFISSTRSYFFEPELHRLKGKLLMAAGDRRDEAEASFERGLVTARNQGSLSLELRAALGLGELWRERGRSDEAERLVAGVVARFDEGGQTPDQISARAVFGAPA